ncbi:MAG: acyl-CoA dehydrogenase family protein [Actinomycetota bacterium]
MPLRPSAWLTEEQRAFTESVKQFALQRLHDPAIRERDAAGTFWREGWTSCAQMGLCGLPAPVELEGSGADRVTTAAALEALGYGCVDFGLAFSINAHLWSAVVPLWQHGNTEQQALYLPRLCRGESIGLHAMTEPESGSDAFSLRTTATRSGEGWVLNGRKTFITNSPVADLFIVFARSPGSEGPLGVSAFLVEAGAEGLEVEQPIGKLGLRTSPMAEIALDGVAVGPAGLLGREGRGAKVFATSMEWERSLIMAAQLGALARALDDTVAYARERSQFGVSISSFQAVADRLVDTHVALESARSLLYDTAAAFDRGEGSTAMAAMVKLAASETAMQGMLDLMQVHGGYGYSTEGTIERRLRDAIGGRIYSGTSDLMRRVIARELGL